MKALVVSILISCLCVVGCATGRFAALDLDMRTPAQIKAFQIEAGIPYQVEKEGTDIRVGSIPWKLIADFLGILKGRIRILSFEWEDK